MQEGLIYNFKITESASLAQFPVTHENDFIEILIYLP